MFDRHTRNISSRLIGLCNLQCHYNDHESQCTLGCHIETRCRGKLLQYLCAIFRLDTGMFEHSFLFNKHATTLNIKDFMYQFKTNT